VRQNGQCQHISTYDLIIDERQQNRIADRLWVSATQSLLRQLLCDMYANMSVKQTHFLHSTGVKFIFGDGACRSDKPGSQHPCR